MDLFFRVCDETHAGTITRVFNHPDGPLWIWWTEDGPLLCTEYPLRNAFGY